MALTGIINLAERLLNESVSQTNPTQGALTTATPASHPGTANIGEDRFTPSANGANPTGADAGVFQGVPTGFFSALADFLLFQATGLPPSAPAATQAPNAAAATAQQNQQNPSTQANTLNPAPQVTAVAVPAAPVAAPAAVPSAAAGATQGAAQGGAVAVGVGGSTVIANAPTTSTPSSQTQLQSLNNALAALGLNASELAEVDRIATFLNDFNPQAFTSLVYQLEALAQSNGAQAITTNPAGVSPANANSITPANAATAALTTTSNAPTGTFQIQSLNIQFSGAQATLPVSGGNGNRGNIVAQISTFNLQIQQITLTLSNNNGQTVQVQAPPEEGTNLPNGTPLGIAPRAKAIAATA